METIKWMDFLTMLPFCLFGFLVHLAVKLVSAFQVSGFSFKEFIRRQWPGWVLAWFFCIIGVYFTARGFSVVEGGYPIDLIGILIGISGGSLGKNAVKIALGFKNGNGKSNNSGDDINGT